MNDLKQKRPKGITENIETSDISHYFYSLALVLASFLAFFFCLSLKKLNHART